MTGEEGMRDGGERSRGEEPREKGPFRDGQVHLAVCLVRRAEDSTLSLALGIVNHPLPQRHLEEDPEDHRHEKAAGELGGDELPSQQDQEDEAQLEDEVGGSELEDDRVDEAGPSPEERPGHGNSRVRAGRARRAEAAGEDETLEVGLPECARHSALRNDRLDHGREQEAEGERPEDLPEHEERDLQGVQDRVDRVHSDLAPHQSLNRIVELTDLLGSAA